ncbi:MAG: DUF2158 domain-containing protein [Flavobacteriales bacterium]|nr:DUF2158 domain-containing protein [Flavobacteriales bacterium]MCB9447872.1 DUF2158 domain-containing protein [Flavobacteriales bacterium]
MMIRIFKPGDRVQLKSGGPVMIVQRYAREHHPLIGWYEDDHAVECSWYDRDGYHKDVIHQNHLVKVEQTHSFHAVGQKPAGQGMFPAKR